jgi:tRNA dimethylallyltransferase
LKAAILIAGPTASGKSALALELAERLGGVIVNADSMQVYRELRVLTARPTPDEEARAPHRLYGFVSARERFSVGRWLRAVEAELEAARKRRQVAIVVGGTGLYFKALTEGLAAVPDVPAEAMENWRAEAERVGAEVLHAVLAARDPRIAARIAPGDSQRIVRALGVLDSTGRSLLDFHGKAAAPPLVDPAAYEAVFLDPDRAWLHARIDARFAAMLDEGGLEEARALMEMGLDPSLPAMRAHGVAHLIAHLQGRTDLDAAAARASGDTRRYAKRQKTWFRHQMPGFAPLGLDDLAAYLASVGERLGA